MEVKFYFSKLLSVQTDKQNQTANLPPTSFEKEIIVSAAPPSPNNPPWNSLTAFGTWLASIFLIILATNLVVMIYIATQHLSFASSDELVEFVKTDPTALLLQIAAIIPAHILTLVLAWAVITRFNKYPFRKMVGWRWGGFNVFHIIGIIIGFFVLTALLTSYFGEQDHELMRILRSSRTAVYVTALMATFSAPIVEESIYRGILYSAFQRKFGVALAVVSVTILFAGVHFVQYWNSPVALLMVTSLSLVLTMVRVKTDNLLPCIVLHTAFNGIQSLLLILEPYLKTLLPNTEQTGFIFHLIK